MTTDPPPTDHAHTPSRSIPPTFSAGPSPIWKTPPAPVRTYSDAVAKRKQPSPPPVVNTPSLTPLKTPSTLRKILRTNRSPIPMETPTLSQALDSQTSDVHSTPASSVGDPATDTDSMTWEDTQTDDDLPIEESLPLTQGPLSQPDILKFLSSVKGRKKPIQVARKFTSNIPGLVKQLKPLKNSPLLKRNMQQRIYKLISTLDK